MTTKFVPSVRKTLQFLDSDGHIHYAPAFAEVRCDLDVFAAVISRKLHCTRNYIHINLMISFIVRYIVILMIISNVHTDLSGDTTRPLDCDSSPGISGVLVSVCFIRWISLNVLLIYYLLCGVPF